jgi:hypothetical protein
LLGLEAIAKRQSTVPTIPSTRIDPFPRLSYQSDRQERCESVFNDIGVQGTLLESFSHTFTPVNHQAGNEDNLPGCVPGCAQSQPITGETMDQDQGDVGLLDGSAAIPLAIDPTLAVYSDDIFSWQLSSASQNIDGMEESRFPSRQDDIQQDPPYNMTPVPVHSSGLVNTQLSEDIMNRKFTLQDILIAGIPTLSNSEKRSMNSASSEDPGNETRRIRTSRLDSDNCRLPDIRMNTIQLTTTSFVVACISNAAMLGLSPAELMNKKSQSPFYQAQISHEVAQTACTGQFVHLKPYLRPSTTQLVYPHHPYLDILPFPAFRNRTIQLLRAEPQLFDPEELCRDLQSDGLICWGSTVRNGSDSAGLGAPWDIRSWEIQPWFLKKWWLLIDGVDGEMYQQARWWCEVRGEKSSYPWQNIS